MNDVNKVYDIFVVLSGNDIIDMSLIETEHFKMNQQHFFYNCQTIDNNIIFAADSAGAVAIVVLIIDVALLLSPSTQTVSA